MKCVVTITVLVLLFLTAPAFAQEEGLSSQELAEEAQNPVSTLRALAFQTNLDFGLGPNERTGMQLNIQPWRAQIGSGVWWNMRSFSAFPIIYRPDLESTEGGTFGLGDPNISLFWSPGIVGKQIVGIGPVISIPLATDESLGTGKWSAGISAVAVVRPRAWLLAMRAFNLWSFAGDPDRPDVNQFLLQYFVLHPLGGGWYLVSSPIVTANWEAESGDEWLVPIGGGGGKVFRLGGRGIDLQVQAFYYAIHPESLPYPDWTLRVQFQFLFVKQ